MKNSTFITRAVLKNYKSIAACNVRLQPLTFLVGRNGSGKSNFLDALRFVADSLNTSLQHAVRDRGGIGDVRRRSNGPPNPFSIRLEFSLPGGSTGHYAFRIGTLSPGGYEVQTEECRIQNTPCLASEEYFRVENGTVTDTSMKVAPAAATDRLYLVNASGLPEFRPVYDAFSRMGFYNLNPDKIRNPQAPDSGDVLMRDGGNLTSVFSQLSSTVKVNIEEFLTLVVPDIREVDVTTYDGTNHTLAFRHKHARGNNGKFSANNMSDGTLRLLGVLVALFQEGHDVQKRVRLVGIEEPEIAIHPAAVGLLLDGFRDAAEKTQVVITSHSPDLLEDKHLDVESILAVEAYEGKTVIAPVDDASRSVVRDKLYTIGELLRIDQLQPDPNQAPSVNRAKVKQLDLFTLSKRDTAPKKEKGTPE